MKKHHYLFVLILFWSGISTFAQPSINDPLQRETGKCYAKCLIQDEYETVTERMETKAATNRTQAIPAIHETTTERIVKKAAATRLIAVPAKYETITERVKIKEETKKLVYVPATYETISEQIKIKEASREIIPIPATYETISEKIMVKEAYSKIERIPAKYETITERVEVNPSTTKWVKRKADKNCLSADPNDCLVWCLVEVPAEFKTVRKKVKKDCASGYTSSGEDCVKKILLPAEYATQTRRVLKTPATTREQIIPAAFKTITKRVIKTPATTREEIIPAEYATVTKQRLVSPATTREEIIPAEYATVTKQVLKQDVALKEIIVPAEYTTVTKKQLVKKGGFTEWREVICANKLTSQLVKNVQTALKARGYNPGPVDNQMGTQTKAALVKFQKANSLPVGQLDIQTLQTLGVSL